MARKAKKARNGLLDQDRLGDLIEGMRTAAGYPDRKACVAALNAAGYPMTDSTLGAIERGEKNTPVEELVMLTLLFRPPGGIMYFILGAMLDAPAQALRDMNRAQ